jgi:hypothetical protein
MTPREARESEVLADTGTRALKQTLSFNVPEYVGAVSFQRVACMGASEKRCIRSYIMIAGGIGNTPLLSMARTYVHLACLPSFPYKLQISHWHALANFRSLAASRRPGSKKSQHENRPCHHPAFAYYQLGWLHCPARRIRRPQP